MKGQIIQQPFLIICINNITNYVYDMMEKMPAAEKGEPLQLFNGIWQRGNYPDKWRETLVILIPKHGKDPTNPMNYRPISSTSCFGKILEKMVSFRLVWYIENEQLLSAFQMGLRLLSRKHLVAIFFIYGKPTS
ncbi:hypothetical protein JTB14_022331 [Gonioctena quinquepunctata]|nr:hypothetical protein JTB14_022331 [Gonioctena quinquepunctata]